MKRELIQFSQRYRTALKKCADPVRRASPEAAERLGHQATALGLETLGLARIHDQALATLDPSNTRKWMRKQTDAFFVTAIVPIERTHHGALTASAPCLQVAKALRQRTRDLAASNQRLNRRIVDRKALERTLKKSEDHYTELLEESRKLQQHLRQLTHQVLSAQENERGKISRQLHDEIGQTLVGIYVRLTTLSKGASVNNMDLKKQIATAQRLVDNSTKSMQRFASEFGQRHGK